MPRSAHIGPEPLYEKSENVFCATSGAGVLLHNFTTGEYVELDRHENAIWLLLDGVHSAADIAAKVGVRKDAAIGDGHASILMIDEVIQKLCARGFIVPRESTQ